MRQLAAKIAEVARLLQKRESVEIADAKTRKELNFAARKNLRIARFLNRIVFCLFAEDTQLLPPKLFTEILKTAGNDPAHFARTLESLFAMMAIGGAFGPHKIRHFNGHLFEEATVFELNEAELGILLDAAVADWQNIQPSIMGTLFERALDESQRAQLTVHSLVSGGGRRAGLLNEHDHGGGADEQGDAGRVEQRNGADDCQHELASDRHEQLLSADDF